MERTYDPPVLEELGTLAELTLGSGLDIGDVQAGGVGGSSQIDLPN